SGNPPQAAPRQLETTCELATLRLIEVGKVEAGHGFPVAGGSDLAHELPAFRTAQQRPFGQHDVGSRQRRSAADGARLDVTLLRAVHSQPLGPPRHTDRSASKDRQTLATETHGITRKNTNTNRIVS